MAKSEKERLEKGKERTIFKKVKMKPPPPPAKRRR
jgi:hypothetical protein